MSANTSSPLLRMRFIVLLVILLLLILYSLISHYTQTPASFSLRNQSPSFAHWFGTDNLGRDFWVRCFQAAFTSIIIGLSAAFIGGVLALLLSALSMLHPYFERLIHLITQMLLSLPHLLLLILISFAIGGNELGVIMAIALTRWPQLTLVLRNEIIKINRSDYIMLSRCVGNSALYRWLHHLFPTLFTQWLIGSLLMFPSAIMHSAALSFLGFGLSQDQASLGLLLSDSLHYLNMGSWWVAVFPGLMLLFIVLLFDHLLRLVKKIMMGELC